MLNTLILFSLPWIQIWRAIRLVVDTGLHAKGFTRQDVLKMFEKYAWDTSDVALKEATRYQSGPGQATSYMIGQLIIQKSRDEAKKKLGKKFDLKEFHYQESFVFHLSIDRVYLSIYFLYIILVMLCNGLLLKCNVYYIVIVCCCYYYYYYYIYSCFNAIIIIIIIVYINSS